MYIRKRKEFLILENLKQAREYLTDNNIDTDLPEFQHIVKTLNKQPNLIDTFTRMVFKDGLDNLDTNIGEFDRIYNWITNNRNIVNQLPKNLMQYKNLEDIADDITRLEYDRKVNSFTRNLPPSTRKEILRLSDQELDRYKELVISYLELEPDQQKMLPPLPTFQRKYGTSIRDLINSLDTLINTPEDLDEEKRRVWELIDKYSDRLNIFYDKDNVVVIETSDKEAVCSLGSGRWCFVYAPETYYKQYVDPSTHNTQYIIFNFNLPSSSRYSMFGVTLNISGDPVYGGSQDRTNEPVQLEDIYDLTGLPKGLLVSKFKSIHDKLYSELEDIKVDDSLSHILELKKSFNEYRLKLPITDSMTKWLDNRLNMLDNDTDSEDVIGLKEIADSIGMGSYAVSTGIMDWLTKRVDNLGDNPTFEEILELRQVSIELRSLRNFTTEPTLKWFMKQFDGLDVKLSPDTIINAKDIADKLHISDLIVSHLRLWLNGQILGVHDDSSIEDVIAIIETSKKIGLGDRTKQLVFNWTTKYVSNKLDSLNTEITKNDVSELRKDISKLGLARQSDRIFVVWLSKYTRKPRMSSLSYNDILKVVNYSKTLGIHDQMIKHPLDWIIEYSTERITKSPNTEEYNILIDIFHKAIELLSTNIRHVFNQIIDNIMDQVGDVLNVFKALTESKLDKGVVGEFTQDYLTSSSIESFSDVVEVYKQTRESLNSIDFLELHIIGYMVEYIDEIEDITDFLLKEQADGFFDITVVLEYEESGDSDSLYEVDNYHIIESLGKLFIALDKELNGELSTPDGSILMYSAGWYNPTEYMDYFYEGIGLKYHDEHKVWYTVTDFTTLGDYFNNHFDFSDTWMYFENHQVDKDAYTYVIDDISIYNLFTIAKYLKDNGFDIDISIIDKYKEPTTKYSESMTMYREDDKLRELLYIVEDIIKEDDDDDNDVIMDIRDNINIAYSQANRSALEGDYFNEQISVIGDTLFEQWPDTAPAFGNSYLLHDSGSDGAMVIPDMEKVFDVEEDVIGSFVDYHGGYYYDIESLLSIVIDRDGKLEWAHDSGYVTLKSDDYDYFNEVLFDELREKELRGRKNENIILNFSDYLRIK